MSEKMKNIFVGGYESKVRNRLVEIRNNKRLSRFPYTEKEPVTDASLDQLLTYITQKPVDVMLADLRAIGETTMFQSFVVNGINNWNDLETALGDTFAPEIIKLALFIVIAVPFKS